MIYNIVRVFLFLPRVPAWSPQFRTTFLFLKIQGWWTNLIVQEPREREESGILSSDSSGFHFFFQAFHCQIGYRLPQVHTWKKKLLGISRYSCPVQAPCVKPRSGIPRTYWAIKKNSWSFHPLLDSGIRDKASRKGIALVIWVARKPNLRLDRLVELESIGYSWRQRSSFLKTQTKDVICVHKHTSQPTQITEWLTSWSWMWYCPLFLAVSTESILVNLLGRMQRHNYPLKSPKPSSPKIIGWTLVRETETVHHATGSRPKPDNGLGNVHNLTWDDPILHLGESWEPGAGLIIDLRRLIGKKLWKK